MAGVNPYWVECIEVALDEVGIAATQEQIEEIAGHVEGGAENYGMSHGYDDIPNPQTLEIDQLKKDLKAQRQRADNSSHFQGERDNWKYTARRRGVVIDSLRQELKEAQKS